MFWISFFDWINANYQADKQALGSQEPQRMLARNQSVSAGKAGESGINNKGNKIELAESLSNEVYSNLDKNSF